MAASGSDRPLLTLMRLVAVSDIAAARKLLAQSPQLATAKIALGASRQESKRYFLAELGRQVYASDTALHIAAAAYEAGLIKKLVAMGADVRARNRRGAEPLHSASVGAPGSHPWNPRAQVAAIESLIALGADPKAVDKSGVTALHRAVRTRCTAACKALLDHGADLRQTNNSGSDAMTLVRFTTGASGSGSPAAKAEQRQIALLLEEYAARN